MVDPNLLAVIAAAAITAIASATAGIIVGGMRYVANRESNAIQQAKEDRERIIGLEQKVNILSENEIVWITKAREFAEERDDLHEQNQQLKRQIASLQRKLKRLENELEILRIQVYGDGTDTGPLESA